MTQPQANPDGEIGQESAGTDEAAASPAPAQGYRWSGEDEARLRQVLEAAFDYRGNVTLQLRDGGELEGYVFNRSVFNRATDVGEAWLEVLPTAGGRERIPYARVAGVDFTGKDTAAGKSWETWMRKWQAKKDAEARGEDVESIDLYPDEP